MTDQTENQPEPPHPEKKSNPADKDETRPTRRITHPDRTRLSRPPVPPPPAPGDKKPASPVQQPGLPETEPDLRAVPQKKPSIRPGEPAVQSDQRPAAPANPNLTRPTRPVARQQKPAFTQQSPPGRPPPRSQPHPPPQPAASYLPPTQEVQTRPPSQDLQPTVAARPVQAKPKRRLWRTITTLFWIGLILGVLALGTGLAGYVWIALQLPPAEELRARSFRFATTQILDRDGNLLWEIIDPTGGRRTRVPLDQISPDLINATVATEDRFFYANVGVDPVAVVRAVYYNVSEGEIVSGGSTITQQLARNVLLSPEERTEQSLSRKIREAVLAVEINRQYSKEQILDVYLNQIYYGNLAYGIEAASQTYFGKRASDLNLAEASMLAGLPQAPSIHDPYLNPEGAKARQADVLRLMVEAGYITAAKATEAGNTPLDFREVNFALEAPHFVSFVRQELERNFPADYIYQAGLRVKTTLDPRLQAIAEEEVRLQVDALAGRNVTNGALVSVDVATGQVLAMVGSKDFENEAIDGQVNMATSPRQPGSSIKPLTYLATFETLNWTPSTLIMDTPVEYPDGAGGIYRPLNYDEKFHGPVSLRRALANSYNIPPVKALALLGVDKLQQMAARLGITTLSEGDFGLSLTLGGGEVPLVEMTGAYQAMANQGVRLGPTAILEITDNFGRVVGPIPTNPQQVLREEHAYLISHILADNEARTAAFGPNSVLVLSRPAAAKTGTTTDFRDSWIMGYTPDIVTGVWVGNADNTPMSGIGGSNGAGPIWQRFM
ncbi:MAG: PBP1A family penicillin-binding protein, partial [Anaerolineae bacterium]|nr:PBP1A family penicillin-binding protein [Anaerolineae bacterium]